MSRHATAGTVRKHGGDGGHRVEGGGLVQRRQRCEIPQRLDDLGVEAHRSGEPRAAVDHAVGDRVRAAHAVERLAELLGVGPPGGGRELRAREQLVVVAEESQLERARARVDGEDPHGARTVPRDAAARGEQRSVETPHSHRRELPDVRRARSRESRPMLSIPLLHQVTVGEVMHEGIVTCSASARHRPGRGGHGRARHPLPGGHRRRPSRRGRRPSLGRRVRPRPDAWHSSRTWTSTPATWRSSTSRRWRPTTRSTMPPGPWSGAVSRISSSWRRAGLSA